MGNNHDKFFSKNKRKLLVLGVQDSGKSSKKKYLLIKALIQTIKMKGESSEKPEKEDLNITDIKYNKLIMCFFVNIYFIILKNF